VLLIAGIVLLVFLPSPWNLVALLGCLVGFVGELAFWRHRMRRTPVQAGAETLVGRTATVVTPCTPRGQVKLRGEGELWEAVCEAGAQRGDTVRVVAVDRNTLRVERAEGRGV
jgi:membrane protein implicated in regulation of membrane protease activity